MGFRFGRKNLGIHKGSGVLGSIGPIRGKCLVCLHR